MSPCPLHMMCEATQPFIEVGYYDLPPLCNQRLSGPSVQPPLHLSSGPSSWSRQASSVGMQPVPSVTSCSSPPHLECSKAPVRHLGPILQGSAPSEPDKAAVEIPECLPEGERRSVLERKRYFCLAYVKASLDTAMFFSNFLFYLQALLGPESRLQRR